MKNGLIYILMILLSCCRSDGFDLRKEKYFQNDRLLEKAWSLPVARLYKKHFEYQNNFTFCGPTSILNTLKSFEDVKVNQSNILKPLPISSEIKIRTQGMTLDEVSELTKSLTQKKVTIYRDFSLISFKEELKSFNDPTKRIIVNFHRKPLFSTGGGHHSPIGGFLEEDNLVFILDVNENYTPFLVTPEKLFLAMDTLDNENNRKRGLIVIEGISK